MLTAAMLCARTQLSGCLPDTTPISTITETGIDTTDAPDRIKVQDRIVPVFLEASSGFSVPLVAHGGFECRLGAAPVDLATGAVPPHPPSAATRTLTL